MLGRGVLDLKLCHQEVPTVTIGYRICGQAVGVAWARSNHFKWVFSNSPDSAEAVAEER